MRAFYLDPKDDSDGERVTLEVFHSELTHPSIALTQADEMPDGTKINSCVLLSEHQMRELRDLIDRTLADEFK